MGKSILEESPATEPFASTRLERVFNDCFAGNLRTRLQGGAGEPLYQPAVRGGTHVLSYRADYFASALHEVAHWCIAGPQRRQQVDFGYWYAPDGRSPDQQRAFEAVEYKPQALEWFFALACAYPFRVSVDNLDGTTGEMPDTAVFRQRVYEQALCWRRRGLPQRAAVFFHALSGEFGTSTPPEQLQFTLAGLAQW